MLHFLPWLCNVHGCLLHGEAGVNAKAQRAPWAGGKGHRKGGEGGRGRGGADGSQQGSTWGFCPAFLNHRTDFLLESPGINEPIVLLPGIIRLWGHDKKGTETIFEKFSKVSEGHIRPPLPFISAGSRKGETRGDCVVGSFGRGLCYSEVRLRK